MSTNSQASSGNGHDRDRFEDAVREELCSRGFCKGSRAADGTPLWRHRPNGMTVLGVTRDRDRWSEAADDPLEEGVLLIGGIHRIDQLYLFEYAICCWGEQWEATELRERLEKCAQRAKGWVDGHSVDDRDVDVPPMISFREMLELATCDQTRSDLESRFSPEGIESTLRELWEVRTEFLKDLLGQ